MMNAPFDTRMHGIVEFWKFLLRRGAPACNYEQRLWRDQTAVPARVSRILMLLLIVTSFVEVRIRFGSQPIVSMAGAAVLIVLAVQIVSAALFFFIPKLTLRTKRAWREELAGGGRDVGDEKSLSRDLVGVTGLLLTLYFALAIHLLLRQGLGVSGGSVAGQIAAFAPFLTGGLAVGEILAIIYYYSRRRKLRRPSIQS